MRGFTLIEILIVVAIFTVLALGVATFGRDIFSFNRFFYSTLEASNDAQKVLKPMVGEIRSATQSSVGSYHIEKASSDEFIFFADIIGGNQYIERVRYFTDGDVLKKGVTVPSGDPLVYDAGTEEVRTLIRNASVLFSYYDSTYTGSEDPLPNPVNIPSIRLIEVVISIEADPSKSPEPITVTSQATLRNLKDNL